MLRSTVLAFAFVIGTSATSHADWIVRTGEDPMTDQKWFAIASQFGQYALTFKCWKGDVTQLAIVLGRYENLPYKDAVQAKMRVDRSDPIDLVLIPTEMSGALVLQMSSEISDEIVPLLKQIGAAKNRVVLSIGTVVLQSNAKGAAKGVQTMISGCEITDKTS